MREGPSAKEIYLQKLCPIETAPMLWAKEQAAILNKAAISLNSYEAKLLQFFITTFKCTKVVEIGTLTGYSALWILAGLPTHGKLWTLEKDSAHAEIAKQVFAKSGYLNQVELLVGDAIMTLPELAKQGPFDAVFIDGNKSAYLEYLQWAEKNLVAGGLILADNTFLRGAVYGGPANTFSKKQIAVMNDFNLYLATSAKFQSIMIPTDEGFTVAYKK